MNSKKKLILPLLCTVVMILCSACSPKEISELDFQLKLNGNPLPERIEMIVGDEVTIDHAFVVNGKNIEYNLEGTAFSDVIYASSTKDRVVVQALEKGDGDLLFSVVSKGYENKLVTIPFTVSKPPLEVKLTQETPATEGASPEQSKPITINGEPVPAGGFDQDFLNSIMREKDASAPILEAEKLTMAHGTTAVIQLEAPANTTYTLKSEGDDIAKAELKDNILQISASTKGTTKIKIHAQNEDYEPADITIEVQVTLTPVSLDITSTQTDVTNATVEMGTTLTMKAVTAPTGAVLSATCDNDNMTVSVSKDVLNIKPSKLGKSTITVTASKENYEDAVFSFDVIAVPTKVGLTVDNPAVAMVLGSSATINTTLQSGATLTLDYPKDALEITQEGGKLHVKGLKLGEFSIKLTAQQEDFIDNLQTIKVQVTNEPLVMAAGVKSATGEVGKNTTVNFTVSQPDATVTATIHNNIAEVSVTNGVLHIKPTAVGDAVITLTATKEGYGSGTLSIALKVSEAAKIPETVDDLAASVFNLVNKARKAEGLSPLTYSSKAQKAADIRAKEIIELFSHTRPDGSDCFTALSETGVTMKSAGENLASGYETPKAVVDGWLASPGHRENIMRPDFTELAVGVATDSFGTIYWSQFFLS